jgi:hypothetical protein
MRSTIPWRFVADLDTQKQLFHNVLETKYKVAVYICSCGLEKFIITSDADDIEYVCLECENSKFYDANYALLSMNHFLYTNNQFNLEFQTEVSHTKEETKAVYFINPPYQIDLLQEKISFKKSIIHSFSFSSLKETYEYQVDFNKERKEELEQILLDFIEKNPSFFNIPFVEDKKINIPMAIFFQTYCDLDEFDFYYWEDVAMVYEKALTIPTALNKISNNRKEKSIRKAIFSNYQEQREDNYKYRHILLNLFSKNIQDCNLLLKYINLPICSKDFSAIDLKNIKELLHFLQTHYTDKQILKILEDVVSYQQKIYFIDMLNQFSYAKNYIDEDFKKVKCSLHNLHDIFVKITNLYIKTFLL